MTSAAHDKQGGRSPAWAWLGAGALVGLVAAAYLPVWHAGFVFDDSFEVVGNGMLRTWQGLRDMWYTTRPADPYPITMSALWTEYHLWGLNPLGYHLVSIFTHALGAVVLWRVLLRMALPGAWLAAAVFAVHPVCAASAAWVSEQKNTFSVVFYLLCVLWFLRFDEDRREMSYGVALVFFVFALMSKGSVVMLPVVLLLLLWWRRGTIEGSDLARLAPFFALSLGESWLTIWFQLHKAFGGEMNQGLSHPATCAAAAWAFWFYLWKAWLPVNLCVIYPNWHVRALEILAWVPAVAMGAVFAVGLVWRKTWGRHVILGLGAFAATLFPVAGIIPMYFLVYSRVGDHLQYLALLCSVPLAVCSGVHGFRRLAARYHWPAASGWVPGVVLVASLGVGTEFRAAAYATQESLWTDTVRKNPDAWMAWNNLGEAYDEGRRTDDAIAAYRRAVKVNTNFPGAESNLGNALVAEGKLDEAAIHLRKAVEEEPKFSRFHFNYGVGLAQQGKLDEAAEQYRLALKLQPGYGEVHNNLSSVLYKQNKFDEALKEASIAAHIRPGMAAPFLNAAHALVGLGRTGEAAHCFELCIQAHPNLGEPHYEYAMLLYKSGDLEKALTHFEAFVGLEPGSSAGHAALGNTLARLQRLKEAAPEFLAAANLEPNNPVAQENLALALTQLGQLDEAEVHYRKVIELQPQNPEAHYKLAGCLAIQGKRPEAEKECEEALRLRPDYEDAKQELEVLRRNP